ncbi:hypothetical protein Ato02nite_074790 [Paractinoplanes toevensis]|uniref:Uncharacterized protein n=1 Tax=Paractinoplanes toevensis TaxID=571911 RepID=A0A919TIL9_9ACTN|nr:hypothetical protein Ato02nite_074790 [Actinoplanes toevensis]
MLIDPSLDILTPPYTPLSQVLVWRWPVKALRELMYALPTYAEPPTYLSRTHQMPRHVTRLRVASTFLGKRYKNATAHDTTQDNRDTRARLNRRSSMGNPGGGSSTAR